MMKVGARVLVAQLLNVLLAVSTVAAANFDYVAPRGPGGRPDLNGTWQVLNRANDDLEPHAARAARAFRPGPVVPVPAKAVVALGAVGAVPASLGVVVGGSIPYLPGARDKQIENAENWLSRDPEIKCYCPVSHARPIYRTRFRFSIMPMHCSSPMSMRGAVRNIHLSDPGPAPIDSWMGQSVGHWDGDTLVIETTGQNAQTWLDRAGNYHSDALRVTERFTPSSTHTLMYEATLEDAKVFTQPWTIQMTLYRRLGADARLQQFNCVEFVEELLYGHLRKTPLP